MSQDIYRIYFGLRDGRELHADLPVINGEDGSRGTGILKVTTAPSSYTTATGGFTPTYRIALSTVKNQAKVSAVLVGDTVMYSYYHYPVGYVDTSYVYLGARNSIRGSAGAAGAPGTNGTDGYTPVKGVDYNTPADQEAIVQQVIAALGTPVFGRVEADNKIILTANGLPDGTYELWFEDEDGAQSEICELTKGNTGPAYTNVIPLSTDASGNPYNGGLGYREGYRYSNSGGGDVVGSGLYTTGYIKCNGTDTLYFKNVGMNKDAGVANGCHMYLFTALDAASTSTIESTTMMQYHSAQWDANGNIVSLKVTSSNTNSDYWVRFNTTYLGPDSIITINEPIDDDGSSTTYTNVLPTATTDIGGTAAFNGKGYKENTRWSNSGGGVVDASGVYLTGFMPVPENATVYLKNVRLNKNDTASDVCNVLAWWWYGGTLENATNYNADQIWSELSATWDADGNLVSFVNTKAFTHIRLNSGYIGPDSIITINEPITDDDSSPTYTNLFDPATAVLNTRMSGSTSTSKAENGYVMTATINIPSVTVYETANDSSPYIVVPEGMWSGSANIFMGRGSAYGVAYMSINQAAGTTQNGWTKIPLSSQWGGDHEIDNLIVSLFVKSSAITTSDIQNIQIYFNESPV